MNEKREKAITQLCEWFDQNQLRLGLAESCTGGLLSSWFVARSGVSKFFQGAVVSYAGDVKVQALSVSTKTLETYGEVSEPVALEMAKGACKNLHSDWSVSITGVAGPSGGTPDKPVGTVCFGVCGPGFEKTVLKNFKIKERTLLQQESAQFALDFLWQCLPHTK